MNITRQTNFTYENKQNQPCVIRFGQNLASNFVNIDAKNLYRITKTGLSALDSIFMGFAKNLEGSTSIEQKYLTLQKSADVFTKMNDNISDYIKLHNKPDNEQYKRATHASIRLESAERYYEGSDNIIISELIENNQVLKDISESIIGNLKVLSRRLAVYRDRIKPN